MNAPNPLGHYNQAVKAGGFLFISGQLPIESKNGNLASVDIEGQTKQVIENVKAILEEAGCTLKDVVNVTVYLSSMKVFDDFNREYAKYFPEDFPARAVIGGVELKAGALLMVSGVAWRE